MIGSLVSEMGFPGLDGFIPHLPTDPPSHVAIATVRLLGRKINLHGPVSCHARGISTLLVLVTRGPWVYLLFAKTPPGADFLNISLGKKNTTLSTFPEKKNTKQNNKQTKQTTNKTINTQTNKQTNNKQTTNKQATNTSTFSTTTNKQKETSPRRCCAQPPGIPGSRGGCWWPRRAKRSGRVATRRAVRVELGGAWALRQSFPSANMDMGAKTSGIPFWLVGTICTTHFSLFLVGIGMFTGGTSGDWDVHWGYGILTHGHVARVESLSVSDYPRFRLLD